MVQEMALQESGIFTDLHGNIFWLTSANDFLGKFMVFSKAEHKDSMYLILVHLHIFYSVNAL